MSQLPAAIVGLLTLAVSGMQDEHGTIGWGIVIFSAGVVVGCACVLVADWRLSRRDRQARQQDGTRAR